MRQVVYRSHAVVPYDHSRLRALLASARRFNAAAEISGVLFYGNGQFIQCIEGPAAAISGVWQRIVSDPAHDHVVLLQDVRITKRSFDQWAMACAELNDSEFQALNDEYWQKRGDQAQTPGLVTMEALWAATMIQGSQLFDA